MYQTGGTVQASSQVGRKDDTGKARWDLVDMSVLDAMVDALTFGAEKYGDYNWQKVNNPKDRYFAALMRHLVAWRKGEKTDESGCSHMSCVMANAMFLEHFDQKEQA